ncbi:8-oxo-dGTP pyrophosphatase MutT (NUDIX family) [Bacillus atrophaeus]|nr:NUDIX domain-containing protein [Bacillus atrophaeus]MDQ0926458.1 8-oxo-dGTP pyrophosphatase MutT (NUDIX family) [Bacillus atrophaeus]
MSIGPNITHTWDGLPVSKEPPFGAAVIVYEFSGNNIEYLILHRSLKGFDYEGCWAWGPPAGARKPNESIQECAYRELLEETGLQLKLKETSFGDNTWCVYYAESSDNYKISLSHEHDKYEWVDYDTAIKKCFPDIVSEQIRKVHNHLMIETSDTGGSLI